jgi:voltage-gated potassium channel
VIFARLSPAQRRLAVAVACLIAITALGTAGYVLVAEAGWIDALYMTVITMSTVGYREPFELGRGGQLFTIALILSTVGLAIYLLTELARTLVEGKLREVLWGNTMQHAIDRLRDHVILCGYGRLGRAVAEDLVRHDVPLVIVEVDPARRLELEQSDLPFVLGSALLDPVLEAAGIDRARAIVAATGSDADNTFIALSARDKNPEIRIHARGESEAAIRRLQLAGAHRVISTYQIAGRQLAASILRPAVVDFLEIARPRGGDPVDLEELHIHAASPLVGRTVGALERAAPRVRVIALKRGEQPIRLIPDEDTAIERGDHLVVIGASESLAALAERASAA